MLCASRQDERASGFLDTNYLSTLEAMEHRTSWQLLEYYALKCRYLMDLRPSRRFSRDCLLLYYQMKSMKMQVPHTKAITILTCYAAKNLLVREGILVNGSFTFPKSPTSQGQEESSSEEITSETLFLSCYESEEATTQPDIQISCLQ